MSEFRSWFRGMFSLDKVATPKLSGKTKREAGTKLVIFVHGLTGSSIGTWGDMIAVFTSELSLTQISFDCYSYPSAIIRTGFGKKMANIQQIASGLRTYLEIEHGNKTEIIIVGHSLGGLIARYFILEEIKSGRNQKIKGVTFFASPHSGAELAAVGKLLSFNQKHLQQLCLGSDILGIINHDWVTLKAEEKLSASFVVGGSDKVVSPESAAPYFGSANVRTLIDYGHTEVIKPINVNDIRFKTLKFFIDKVFTKSQDESSLSPTIYPENKDPLFDFYSPEVELYYIKRQNDDVIFKASRGANIWVSGPTGTGKTVALRRLSDESGWKVQHLSMGSYETREAISLFREICIELFERAGIPSSISSKEIDPSIILMEFRKVLEVLVEKNPVAILVEEIPLYEGHEFVQFIQLIEKLTVSSEGFSLQKRVVWLFSSINNPKSCISSTCIKFRERVQLIEFSAWIQEDIKVLTQLINKEVGLKLTEEEIEGLCQNSNGSPRFIKMVIRAKRNYVGPDKSIIDFISAVKMELN